MAALELIARELGDVVVRCSRTATARAWSAAWRLSAIQPAITRTAETLVTLDHTIVSRRVRSGADLNFCISLSVTIAP
jgi:hypothetical protein